MRIVWAECLHSLDAVHARNAAFCILERHIPQLKKTCNKTKKKWTKKRGWLKRPAYPSKVDLERLGIQGQGKRWKYRIPLIANKVIFRDRNQNIILIV